MRGRHGKDKGAVAADDKATAEAPSDGAESKEQPGGTGRTRRRASETAPPEARSLRQRPQAKEPVKKDNDGGRGSKCARGGGASDKAVGKGASRGGKNGGRGRGRGGKAGGRWRDVEEEEAPEPEPEEEEEVDEAATDRDDHVLISFTTGNSFEVGSVVSVTPVAIPENCKDVEFHAKVLKYSDERKILKLQYEGENHLYDRYANQVLRVGATLACSDGTCAKIDGTDAEWHRGQLWALPNDYLKQKVRWEVEDPSRGHIEQEGEVWGWLPADESEYFPDEPEEKGGKPGPLWRVKFTTGEISDINPADLDQTELNKALELYRTKDARAAAAPAPAEKGAKKRKISREDLQGYEDWTPASEKSSSKRKKPDVNDDIDDDVPIIKRKLSKQV
jgi:hypothetical protein